MLNLCLTWKKSNIHELYTFLRMNTLVPEEDWISADVVKVFW